MFVEMLEDIKESSKHTDVKRRVEEIIQMIKNATSFREMAARLYDLENITLQNT
jgi:hypothetical protein